MITFNNDGKEKSQSFTALLQIRELNLDSNCDVYIEAYGPNEIKTKENLKIELANVLNKLQAALASL